jgi:hypothetical protein
MCPGAILSTTRVGNYYSGRTSNFAANRALASTGRGFAAPYGRQFVPPHNKFVVLDTDEATGTTEISLSPEEQVTTLMEGTVCVRAFPENPSNCSELRRRLRPRPARPTGVGEIVTINPPLSSALMAAPAKWTM